MTRPRPASARRGRAAAVRPPGAAFTLVEVLLAVAVVSLLTVVAVFGFSGWRRAAGMREGCERFAGLLRMARAEAAVTGKRVRVAFVADEDDFEAGREGRDAQVLWEPDPLGEPGVFVPYEGSGAMPYLPTGLARVASCRLTGSDPPPSLGREIDAGGDERFEAITFCPDGTSDSAVVELIGADADSTLVAQVTLSGLTGTVTWRVLSIEEIEQLEDVTD